jgi:EpsI family protein
MCLTKNIVLKFLNSTPARVVTVLLIAQAALLYSSIRPEAVPPGKPLSSFPREIGPWTLVQEGIVDQESQAVLQADDTLVRSYAEAGTNRGANLFIAAFRSQRNGKAPHSPKNCLPGNGWTQLEQSTISIDVGADKPVEANRYIVMHGDSRSMVLYWYQSRDRTVANEFKAKFWVIADAIRYNRTDTALVRVIVPVDNKDSAGAERVATDFVRSTYGTIRSFLPS